MLIVAGSRRLLTYQRLHHDSVDVDALALYRLQRLELQGVSGDGSADELNAFRRKVCCIAFRCSLVLTTIQYFQGFKEQS